MSRWKRAKNENKQLLATSRNGNRSTFVFTSTGKYSVHVEYYCDYYFNKLKITSIIWFNCHLKLYWLWFEFIKKYLLCLVERLHCTRTGTTTWIPSETGHGPAGYIIGHSRFGVRRSSLASEQSGFWGDKSSESTKTMGTRTEYSFLIAFLCGCESQGEIRHPDIFLTGKS